MAEMTSRQRVRAALEHKEPDMVPIDFGAMRSTGISAIAYNKLKQYLGIKEGETRVYDVFQQLAEPELKLVELMGGDVVQLHRLRPAFGIRIDKWKPGKLPDGSECMVPFEFNPVKNEKGDLEIRDGDQVLARMPKKGLYFEPALNRLKDAESFADIDNLPLPLIDEEEMEWLRSQARNLHENTDYAILGEFGGNVFEAGQGDWGFERYYIELGLKSDLVHYYHQRLTEVHMENLRRYLEAVGDYIDVIQFGDDLGTQENSQISPQMYSDLIKPYHSQMFRYVRENYPDVKVFLHCCGSIANLIPELIDAGVEILNPVQLSAKNMDARWLKEQFGQDLVFWGGGCNTQTTLTFGTIEDIRREVKELMHIFAPGGGFVFTQVHNIQANVPPEKVVALYETAKEERTKVYS